jgi:acyl-[acyl-carrier-protein]-phospholipid O-acyltransferase/long-chain-fatty-acid--[acyl-carrier-protein] ligase
MIADKADAQVLPVRIDGAQYTHFSRLKGKLRLRLFPKITITILEPRRFTVPADLRGRRRRQRIGNRRCSKPVTSTAAASRWSRISSASR